jgi:phosphatidate cytidylyltransferase
MTDPEESRAGGRHGGDGGGGLSAAELIARSRAGQSAGPGRAGRSAHRRAAALDLATDEAAAVHRPEPAVTNGTSANGHASTQLGEHLGRPGSNGAVTSHSSTGRVGTGAVRHLSVVDDGPAMPAPQLSELRVAPPPRAGRNLPAAIGVGVGLGLLIIATLVLYRPSFGYVIALAVGIGVYEVVTAISTVEARPSLVPLLAGAAAMQAAAWFRGPEGLVGALLLTTLGLVIWRLADGADGYLRDVAAGELVALYVPFLAGFAVLMLHAGDGVARIILFILTVVCSDTGGYAAGVVFGKHPMAPTVSPKKSWEGLAGSLVAGSASGLLLMTLCFHHQWWQGVLFGVAVVLTATLGDLGESMIKRDLGLKDMGRLLPGHGGIMDRLDSLLPCAPVAYLLLAAFLR